MKWKREPDRYTPDNWTPNGVKILSDENIEKIKDKLSKGPIIVQHCFYRGASCPRIYGFDDFEEFEEHLKEYSIPGDYFDVWSFNDVCKEDQIVANGKLHDTDGCVPQGGAY
ncbi:hypothetical protein, partial [Cerasicoccus arenae]